MTPRYASSSGETMTRAARAPRPRPLQTVSATRRKSAIGQRNGLHHQFLESRSLFSGGARIGRLDLRRQSVGDGHSCKGLGNHEAIPAVEAPRLTRGNGHWKNEYVSTLRSNECSHSKLFGRAARTVWRDRDLMA